MPLSKGFTLIEVMIVIAIIAIFTRMGLPALHLFMQKHSQEAARQDLMGLVRIARFTAVTEGVPTVLCGSQSGKRCDSGTLWRGQVLVFRDTNFNHARDEGEPLLFSLPLGKAILRGTRGLLEFNSSGAGYMGSWIYCSPDLTHETQTFKLVLSLGGRIRSEAMESERCL